MPFGKRQLLIGLAIGVCLQIAAGVTRRILPAQPEVPAAIDGSFQPGGEYPGQPFADAVGVRSWGSWSGSDENVGTLTIGPFAAPRLLRFGASGYPANAGIQLRLENVATGERMPITAHDVGERWRIVELAVPASWQGRAARLEAIDDSRALGGWIAVSEPIRGGRGDGGNALIQSLASWAINGLLLGLVFIAGLRMLDRRSALPSHWLPLAAGAVVAAAGYATFWMYFANALAGVIFSWVVLGGAAVIALWENPSRAGTPTRQRKQAHADVSTVLTLTITVGAFYLGLLHLFPSEHDFYTLAANRYREALPSDNVLPHEMAQRVFASEPLKNAEDEWLSSDRPPLQTGWQLLTWRANKTLGTDRRTASGTSALWFQLLWVAAAYGMLRSLGVERLRAAGWIAAMALSGFFLQNTTYTWPKLSSAAFACGAFGLIAFRPTSAAPRTHAVWSAALAALAWLSHGGVAFSFLALLPLLAWRARRGQRQGWLPAAAVLLLLTLPWLAYQKFYDPPGNRLLKWHLAGQTGKDASGTWDAIRTGYARIGWRETWANKLSNFQSQIHGNWTDLLDPSPATAVERRTQEFFHTGRALTWWPFAALLAVVLTRRRWLAGSQELWIVAGWLALTLVIWCFLMFGRYQASIHHGSYALMLGLFVWLSAIVERTRPGLLAIVTVLQAITLATTWATGNATIHGAAHALPFVIGTGLVLGYISVRAIAAQPPDTAPLPGQRPLETALAASTGGQETRLGAWWRHPRLNLAVLGVLALFLALRKPDALHTPQLWAEDGSIFLVQSDQLGAEAFVKPYMGYLHTLPRIIAWLAPRILDPVWWPAFYNGVSFLVWLAVLARLFTARFNLPGKVWLALAFVLVPHSGEVFFNVTNLQWLTAFVLIQQAIIAPPRSRLENAGDLLILTLVTLTGPFGIAFLPLFVWRWWHDRRRENGLALGVVLALAAVQAWCVIHTGPRFGYQSDPFQLWPNLVVAARRLVVWPVLGGDAARALPAGWIVAIGGLVIVGLLARAFRPGPQRQTQARIAAAFVLITLAAIYRTRPDTWAADNLHFGERYFYIPRVLLAWLLIFQFDASSRALAVVTRVLGLMIVVMHSRDFILPTPPDYHWRDHVAPIRQGIPATIPTLPENWTLEYLGRRKGS